MIIINVYDSVFAAWLNVVRFLIEFFITEKKEKELYFGVLCNREALAAFMDRTTCITLK